MNTKPNSKKMRSKKLGSEPPTVPPVPVVSPMEIGEDLAIGPVSFTAIVLSMLRDLDDGLDYVWFDEEQFGDDQQLVALPLPWNDASTRDQLENGRLPYLSPAGISYVLGRMNSDEAKKVRRSFMRRLASGTPLDGPPARRMNRRIPPARVES